DPHDEYSTVALSTPDGFSLVGARVRGKKHKHEGTNCDDWFSVATAGRWTLIAVSDGAGSKKFSRVGARVSCQAVIRYLAGALEKHSIRDRDDAQTTIGWREDKQLAFADDDVQFVQEKLHWAMNGAYFAVDQETSSRAGNPQYTRALGRPLDIKDLSATLLVAAHTTLTIQGQPTNFVMACQVGDGLTAAITANGQISLLGEPDSGQYSGETDFLTSHHKLKPENLCPRTFVLVQPIRALLVMTDGVADDYFPPDPGMARLYADLVLNGILPETANEAE